MVRGTCGMLVLVALFAGACSDGAGEARPTTSTPSTVEVATAPVATTPIPTTTVPVPSTTPTTSRSAPVTTAAPTTAPPDSLDDLAAAIERDLNDGESALIAAGGAPADAASRQLIATYFEGVAEASLLNFLDTLVAEGNVVRPNPDVPSIVRLSSAPVVLSTNPMRVSVGTCRIDAAAIVAPGGEDVEVPVSIVDDSVSRIDAISTVVLVDGVWQLEGGESQGERQVGVTSCV